jgi:hypothetical protein
MSLCGCARLQRETFSQVDQERATVAGYAGIRGWAVVSARDLAPSILPERPGLPGRFDVLAISGGGSAGAFTTGLLMGWTASGSGPPRA